jgi:adenylosuccinate synthase
LHLIPAGILHQGVICVIGNGVVVDPLAFSKEIKMLTSEGIAVDGRILISENAHIIFPYHIAIDKASEANYSPKDAIGTTGRGIGPAYVDKIGRTGIKAYEILDKDSLTDKIRNNVIEKNKLLKFLYNVSELPIEETVEHSVASCECLIPYITNSAYYLNDSIAKNKNIMIEGAQGALLDVDYGSYPFVTSSNPTAGGACTGASIPPNKIDRIIGITKAYCTRVGNGPFPTEQINSIGKTLSEIGNEFGATTGRPRRCGWLDLVALRYSIMLNGITDIALTKLDVLNDFDEIKVATKYIINGKKTEVFPSHFSEKDTLEVEYETFAGWKYSLEKTSSCSDLNPNAKKYINFIEQYSNAKVSMISTSPERDAIIMCS